MWLGSDVKENKRCTFSLEEALLLIIYYALVFFARSNYLKLIQFNLLYSHCTWYDYILSGESQLQTKQKMNTNLNKSTNNSYN